MSVDRVKFHLPSNIERQIGVLGKYGEDNAERLGWRRHLHVTGLRRGAGSRTPDRSTIRSASLTPPHDQSRGDKQETYYRNQT